MNKLVFDTLNKEDVTTSIFCKKCGKELETGRLYTKYNSKFAGCVSAG